MDNKEEVLSETQQDKVMINVFQDFAQALQEMSIVSRKCGNTFSSIVSKT